MLAHEDHIANVVFDAKSYLIMIDSTYIEIMTPALNSDADNPIKNFTLIIDPLRTQDFFVFTMRPVRHTRHYQRHLGRSNCMLGGPMVMTRVERIFPMDTPDKSSFARSLSLEFDRCVQ